MFRRIPWDREAGLIWQIALRAVTTDREALI